MKTAINNRIKKLLPYTFLLFVFLTINCKSGSIVDADSIDNNQNLSQLQDRTEDINALLVNAVQNKDSEKVNNLLQKGANPNARDKDGQDYLGHYTVLGIAVKNKDTVTARLLLSKGANVNDSFITENGKTSTLCDAVENKDIPMMELLLEFGTDIGKDGTAYPAIFYAKDKTTLDFLIKSGANINSRDHLGWTPLMHAVHFFGGDIDLVKIIISYNPNVNNKSNDGLTALQIAKLNKNKEIIQELRKAGAKQ